MLLQIGNIAVRVDEMLYLSNHRLEIYLERIWFFSFLSVRLTGQTQAMPART